MELSIIVPVNNVEKYIRACLERSQRGRNGATRAFFLPQKVQSFIIALAKTCELKQLKKISLDMNFKSK